MATMTAEIRDWLDDMEQAAIERRAEAQQIIDAVNLVRDFYRDTRQGSSPETVRKAIISFLEYSGQPVHRKEITDTLEAVNVYPKGKDPVASVSSILSRFDGDFKSFGGGRWGLAHWPSKIDESEGGGNLNLLLDEDEKRRRALNAPGGAAFIQS
jgi:hypothetical protein